MGTLVIVLAPTGGLSMRTIQMLCAATLVVATAVPAAAAGSSSNNMMSGNNMMSSNSMMSSSMSSGQMKGSHMKMMMAKPGQVYAIMPDGHVGTTTMSGAKMKSTVGMASAMDNCMMFISSQDGKMYQVDTSSSSAQQECESIAK
jgi:hypothetical protein